MKDPDHQSDSAINFSVRITNKKYSKQSSYDVIPILQYH